MDSEISKELEELQKALRSADERLSKLQSFQKELICDNQNELSQLNDLREEYRKLKDEASNAEKNDGGDLMNLK